MAKLLKAFNVKYFMLNICVEGFSLFAKGYALNFKLKTTNYKLFLILPSRYFGNNFVHIFFLNHIYSGQD